MVTRTQAKEILEALRTVATAGLTGIGRWSDRDWQRVQDCLRATLAVT